MHFDWYSQTITQKTRPLPPTLAAQCHQLYMRQKLYKPQPIPLSITDHSLYFFKTRFSTWSPLVFITSSTTYLESHSFCRNCEELISIKPMQVDFASLCKIIYQKDHLFPNFPFPIEIKKSFLPPPLIVYPLPHLLLLQPSLKGWWGLNWAFTV